MKSLLLPLLAGITLPTALNFFHFAPTYAFPWDKKKPTYIDQEAALDACFDFAKKVLKEKLTDPRKQTFEEGISDEYSYRSDDDPFPLPSPFKNELGEYKILQYGCRRVSKKNSKRIIPEFESYIKYLKIPDQRGLKGNEYVVEEYKTSISWENNEMKLHTFSYEPKESDRPTGGIYDQYGIDQDWIIGAGFGMAYRLCRETFLHKTITTDDLEIRKAADKKYLRESLDPYANQPYPKRITETAIELYEGRLAKCLREGGEGW